MTGLGLKLVFVLLVVFWGCVLVWYWLSGFQRKIKIVTVTGPSGAGKTTIVGELLKKHPEWGMVVSLTSRESRDSDLPGEYKCNLSVKHLYQLEKDRQAIWRENEHGNVYVTLFKDVNEARFERILSFMQILHRSVVKLHSYMPREVLSIFLIPPCEEELRRRFEKRGDSPEQINRRIADCRKWEEEARASGLYKFVRNNKTVEEAIRQVEEIIRRNV